jgi:nucleotide-binding universal stress UspA family protein
MNAEHTVVVGIDGSDAGWRALDWAADIAVHAGRTVRVIHVGDNLPPADETVDPRSYGDALLSDAVARLVESYDHLSVEAELHDGVPASVLIDVSRTAELLVVGRGRHGVAGLLLGSVAHQVVAHGHCPTAVVGIRSEVTTNRIVVGVSDSAGGGAALLFAGAEALRRDAELVAVRAWSAREWRLAAAAALPISSPEIWEAQERIVLEDCVRDVRDTYPELKIRTVLSCTPTEIALEREAHGAVMLVLGCRRADDSRIPRLGPISSWAAHHFDCPVVVVGNPASAVADG